ncbi:DUF2812 domain-containing protein [Bacillus alkalicellulosilyticus]|uniref:DUF2812 domain-containing protein n=1 Tax=Alkalihalobacterium alkalicellulosilyticum TaxID=1912214 RepID=UPI000996B5B2|nr:DUF2812 domain-containing protein [Bacillus alkalicellulosilyticus]
MKTKYIASGGLAFAEKKEMKKLSKWAKKGWLLEKPSFLGYTLQKGEPCDIEYSVDNRLNPDQEYFDMFDAAGWTHVFSISNQLHFFQAPTGTKPIYTDNLSLVDKYNREKTAMAKVLFPTLPIAIILFYFSLLEYTSSILEWTVIILFLFSVVVLVFTGMPYVSYLYKISRLSRVNK